MGYGIAFRQKPGVRGGNVDTTLIAAVLIAYSLGSLPFAYWVSYAAKGIDPRTVGDGNPGAKNVFLQVGHAEGVLVCLLDVGKGSAAVLLGKRLGLGLDGCLVAGTAGIAGHNWPLFLRFRGGQGMAATIGAFLVLFPIETLMGLLAAALVLYLARHWDLACGVGLILIPIAAYGRQGDPVLAGQATLLLPLIGLRKLMQKVSARRRRHRRADALWVNSTNTYRLNVEQEHGHATRDPGSLASRYGPGAQYERGGHGDDPRDLDRGGHR